MYIFRVNKVRAYCDCEVWFYFDLYSCDVRKYENQVKLYKMKNNGESRIMIECMIMLIKILNSMFGLSMTRIWMHFSSSFFSWSMFSSEKYFYFTLGYSNLSSLQKLWLIFVAGIAHTNWNLETLWQMSSLFNLNAETHLFRPPTQKSDFEWQPYWFVPSHRIY